MKHRCKDLCVDVSWQWEKVGTDKEGKAVLIFCPEEEAEYKRYIFVGKDKHGTEWGLTAAVPVGAGRAAMEYVEERGVMTVQNALEKANA